jgi:single-stranded DNA-binding protein
VRTEVPIWQSSLGTIQAFWRNYAALAVSGQPEWIGDHTETVRRDASSRHDNPSIPDANGDDKESLWFNIKAWGDLAENIAETYQNVTNAGGKSMRVVVTGKVIPEKWTDQNGTERTTVSVYLEDLGVSLQYAKVGSVQKSSNPMNSEAFKGAVKKAADIPTPQQTAATSEVYDETGEDGVPF